MGIVRAIRSWLASLCVGRRATPHAPAAATGRQALGPVRADRAFMGFILYVPRASRIDPEAVVDAVLRKHGGFQRTADRHPARLPAVLIEHLPSTVLPRPDRRRMQLVGRALSAQERDTIAESRRAVFLRFEYAGDEAFERIHRAHAIVSELAAAIGTPIQSDDNSLVYGRAAWANRVAETGASVPELGTLVCIHVYPDPGDAALYRLVSLGMAAVGAPDLCLDRVARSAVAEASWLVEAVGQLLVEDGVPDGDGELAVRLPALRGTRLRDHVGPCARPDGEARVRLVAARRQQGDADNRLWAIELPGDGALAERQARTFAALFATTAAPVHDVSGSGPADAELAAALDAIALHARAAVAELAPWERHARAGARLQVKAPFAAPGDRGEVMWIDVVEIRGDLVRGTLASEPQLVTDLTRGAAVAVALADIEDYLLTRADGSTAGGTSVAALRDHAARRRS